MDNLNHKIAGYEPSSERESRHKFNILKIGGMAMIAIFFWVSYQNSLVTQEKISDPFIVLIVGVVLIFKGWDYSTGKTLEPLTVQFYSEYMVVIREFFHYDETHPRMQIDKFYYKDIEKVVWNQIHDEVIICGKADITTIDYDDDDKLIVESEKNYVEDTKCTIRTPLLPDIDFQKEIQENSPLVVEIITFPDDDDEED